MLLLAPLHTQKLFESGVATSFSLFSPTNLRRTVRGVVQGLRTDSRESVVTRYCRTEPLAPAVAVGTGG